MSPYDPFSRNLLHYRSSSSPTGALLEISLYESAYIAMLAPMTPEPPSNRNNLMTVCFLSSTLAEPPSKMGRTRPQWNLKLDASYGTFSALDNMYIGFVRSGFHRPDCLKHVYIIGETNPRIKRRMEFLSAFSIILYRQEHFGLLRSVGSGRPWPLTAPRIWVHHALLPYPWRRPGSAGFFKSYQRSLSVLR